jgi:hypothetical protein
MQQYYAEYKAVADGLADPLALLCKIQGELKIAEQAVEEIKEFKEQLLEYAINEFDRQGEKKLSKYGVEFEKRSSPPKYEYEVDEEYCLLKQKLDDRTTLLKDARKKYESGHSLVVDSEEIPIVPVRSGKEYLIVKF